MSQKTITEFLDKEYKDFSIYTIENRAIPSAIDGLKPSQRKVIYVASNIWKNNEGKYLKIFQLSGRIASEAFFHHGDASLNSAIITMCQKFKNNLPLLEGDGILGSLRAVEAGAPRYVGAKLDKNFRLLYKDFDLLEHKYEEGSKIEPKFYLPIIPTVLVNGTSGIAVGYATNILNRNPIDVLNNCLSLLNGKSFKIMLPKTNEFVGKYINDDSNPKRWIIRGEIILQNTTTVKITELPPSMTYEKYEDILDKLVEDRLIVSYDDNCRNNIDYTIKFSRDILSTLDNDKLIKYLKLEESETEIFTTLDEHGKLKIFESSEEILNHFVNFRLSFYDKRKQKMIDDLNKEKNLLSNRGKFIKMILDGKIEIKSRKKDDLVSELDSLEFMKIEDSYDYLLRMPLWNLTIELFDKLKEDFIKIKSEIEAINKLIPKEMYIKDLEDLKKELIRNERIR